MKHNERNKALTISIIIATLLLITVIGCASILVFRPPFASNALSAIGIPIDHESIPGKTEEPAQSNPQSQFASLVDNIPTDEQLAILENEKLKKQRTPLIARCAGVDLRCPIAMMDLTGLLFHQASYEYALQIETELPEADYEIVESNRSMRINHEQVVGDQDWADTEALHLWRTSDDTDMDTSIDVGGQAGTLIVSPVSGTVVLVRDYMLYDEVPDVEIHIQPEGRADLDCVLIHVDNPLVKAGDRVESGLTPIAHVRDIESSLTDVQLGFFTPEGVGGNHAHVQMNDADFPDYRTNKLDGAVMLGPNR